MLKYLITLPALLFCNNILASTCPDISGSYNCIERERYQYEVNIQRSLLENGLFKYVVNGDQFITDAIKRPEPTGDGATLYVSSSCTNNNFNIYLFFDYSHQKNPFTADYNSEFIKTEDGLKIKDTIHVYSDKNLPTDTKWISCKKN